MTLKSASHSHQECRTTPLEVATGELRSLLLAQAMDRANARSGGAGTQAAALRKLRERGVGTDVALVCGGRATLRCHSAVLAAQGQFWEALLYGPLAKCAQMRPRVAVSGRSSVAIRCNNVSPSLDVSAPVRAL